MQIMPLYVIKSNQYIHHTSEQIKIHDLEILGFCLSEINHISEFSNPPKLLRIKRAWIILFPLVVERTEKDDTRAVNDLLESASPNVTDELVSEFYFIL